MKNKDIIKVLESAELEILSLVNEGHFDRKIELDLGWIHDAINELKKDENQMTNRLGTPQTIEGAIRNASRGLRLDLKPSHVKEIKSHVKDFLAQKFGIWMLQVNEGDVLTLKNLFDAITESEEI